MRLPFMKRTVDVFATCRSDYSNLKPTFLEFLHAICMLNMMLNTIGTEGMEFNTLCNDQNLFPNEFMFNV